MAEEGEQILIYSSHQLFLVHKCFINLTHGLKLELYYNTSGNCFLIGAAQLHYEAAHVGDICRVSDFYLSQNVPLEQPVLLLHARF